ncbi:MAG: transposase [Bacteroidetes bacterium 46-16]|nr:MAG: transposase [Bacteroidetes bacterium 46-16]
MGFSYRIDDQQGLYFITATVTQWVDVFSRREYADIIIDSLKYCQQEKGLLKYGWVIMSNHLHMIAACTGDNELSDTLRDFKKYTASKVVEAIANNKHESRKNWLLWLLKPHEDITFWQPGNHPEHIHSRLFYEQKLKYIHDNPFRAGICDREEAYIYSSARDFYGMKGLLDLSYYY